MRTSTRTDAQIVAALRQAESGPSAAPSIVFLVSAPPPSATVRRAGIAYWPVTVGVTDEMRRRAPDEARARDTATTPHSRRTRAALARGPA